MQLLSSFLEKLLKNKTLVFFSFFLISAFMTFMFFRGLKEGEFLLVGDQFIRFSYRETFMTSFFMRGLAYLGSHSSWQISAQYIDTIFHLFLFSLGFSFFFVEISVVFISIFISLSLSYIGFRRLSEVVGISGLGWPAFVTTLWYCFNPYTLELWHGGVYNLGSALTYSLAPLAFYYIHALLTKSIKKYEMALLALILALSFFTFWLFASLAFVLTVYITFNPKRFLSSIRGFFLVFLLSMPLIIHMVFAILFEYFSIKNPDNAVFVPTYGSQLGGIWYQVLMYFSWGIYSVWYPRSLYSFGDHFFSPWYIVSVCLVYIVGLFGVLRSYLSDKLRALLAKIVFILLLGLFFAKGAQYPLGWIFEFLYKNVPFFSIFRTPDIRFGFVVVFSLAILLLNAAKYINKLLYAILIIVFISFQVPQLFTGIALKGEEVEGRYYDRVVNVPQSYSEVSDFLNADKSFSYILPLPNVEYGYFELERGDTHVGQDILQKLVKRPFFFTNTTAGPSRRTVAKLDSLIKNQEFLSIKDFPVKHIVLRKDVICNDCTYSFDFDSNFPLRFENDSFKVYEVEGYPNVINGPSASFDFINPAKFKVSYSGINEIEELNFLMSYNEGWELYLLPEQGKLVLPRKVFGDTHVLANGYANAWKIDPEVVRNNFSDSYHDVDEDGSLSFRFVIYYTPQLWFNTLHIFSILSLPILLWYIVRKNNDKFFKH